MKLFDRKHHENTKQNMYPVAGGQINYGIQDMPFLVFLDALSRSLVSNSQGILKILFTVLHRNVGQLIRF